MRHSCSVSSVTGLTSPYSPTLSPASFWPLIAVLTQSRSPQTIGLDRPRPGIGVFHATSVPAGDVPGRSAAGSLRRRPLARMPRNCGQSTPGPWRVPAAR